MPLNIQKLIEDLQVVYQGYESAAAQFKSQAVCARGCSFCCSAAGKIDIVTIEGLILLDRLQSMPDQDARAIHLKLERDRDLQLKGKKGICPFLDDQGACLVYEVRSFSCRQLYSLRKCDNNGPLVHRQAVSLAQRAVREIQQIDNTGYSGHHSFILKLLQHKSFSQTYRDGGFDPGKIKKFGKKHGIMINRGAPASWRNRVIIKPQKHSG